MPRRQLTRNARNRPRKVLVVDVGGTHVKVLATGKRTPRKLWSGPSMTAAGMVEAVQRLAADWSYDVVSLGYPGAVRHGRFNRTIPGQYGGGVIGGGHVPGYREEPNVAPDSSTETFVALKLSIDSWRWVDVPFYLRTGKRLPKRLTEIAIQFRGAPLVLFRNTPVDRLDENLLVLHIQPDEGISLRFGAKIPGPMMQMGAVDMNFDYADYFGCRPSTGYERLLYDSMCGDATLFQRADIVEAGWKVVSPIQDVRKALPPRPFRNYAAGTWGPKEADDLLTRDGRDWRAIE